MSSHWGAVSGVALRLNNKDFNNMVETYLQKTYLPDATESDMEEFWDKIEMTLAQSQNSHSYAANIVPKA